MTAIAAVRHEGKVWVGGDSAGCSTGYGEITLRKDTKVFMVGKLLIGYTSSFRMAQLIRYGLAGCESIEDLDPPDKDGFRFMIQDFVPRVRWLFKEGGFQTITDGGQEYGGNFLVAWNDNLFEVSTDYQVVETLDGFAACGSGRDLSLGAFCVLQDTIIPPEQKIKIALDAAERFNAYVRSPFHILNT